MKSGWVTKRLGEVCEEVRERIPSASIGAEQYVGTENMLKECAGIVGAESVPKDVGLVHYLQNDILLSNIRPYLKKVWLSDREGGCSSDVIVLRANKGIAASYIQRVLSQDVFFDYSMLKVSGAKMPRGNRDWIKAFEISFPESLPEQRRIVAKIDAAFAKIDRLKANAEKNLANAKELFQSALNEAMRPKPGWVEKRLGEVAEMVRGPFGGSLKKSCFVERGIPVYEQRNAIYSVFDFRYFITQSKYAEMRRFTARPGDLIMSCSGTIGKIAVIPEGTSTGIINQALLKLTPRTNIMPAFLSAWFCSSAFNSLIVDGADGAAIKNVASVAVLKQLPVKIPPMSEQTRVLSTVAELEKKGATLQSNYTRLIADCAEMRQAVLKEAFEGRL